MAGWIESPRVPHLVLGEGLGDGFQAERIAFTEVGGRPVVVFAGASWRDVPLRVLDLDTGVPLADRSLLHGEAAPRAIGLGRDGDRTLLVTSCAGRVVVRDAVTGEPVGPGIRGPMNPRAVAVGAGLVAVAAGDEIRAWDLDGTPRAAHDLGGHAFAAHDGRLLVITGPEGRLQAVDVRTGEHVGEPFPGHAHVVAAAAYRGQLLVISQADHRTPDVSPHAWNVSTGTEATPPGLWRGGPESKQYAPGYARLPWLNGLHLAEVGGGLAVTAVWRTYDADVVEVWLPGEDGPRRSDGAAVAAVHGNLLAFGGRHGALSVLDLAAGVPLESAYYGGPIGDFGGLAEVGGRAVAILGPDRVWDLEAGRPVKHRTEDIPIRPSGTRHVAAIHRAGIRVWDTDAGTELMRLDHHLVQPGGDPAFPVTVFALDGTLLATGAKDSTVRAWDVTTGEPIGLPWQGGPGGVRALGVTRWRGRPAVIAVHGQDPPSMWLVDAPPRGLGHTEPVSALTAVVRGGRPAFASGDQAGTILLWDPVTGRTTGDPIAAHDGGVDGLAFAGGVLISSGDDGVIQRWDPDTGARIGAPLSVAGGGRAAVAGALVADMPLPRPATLHDMGTLDGKLVALMSGEPDEDLHPDADPEQVMVTIWDVVAATPLIPPLLAPEDRGIGAFAEVGGRLVAVHSVDAGDGEDCQPEEAGDLFLRDLTTGEPGVTLGRDSSWINQIQISTVRGRPVAFIAAEPAVESWDLELGTDAAPAVGGLLGPVGCVAVTEVDGVTFVAAGDGGNAVNIWAHTPGQGR